MLNYGTAPCTICGQVFEKRTHNALVCGEACREKMYKARWGKNSRKDVPSVVSTCKSCGKEFVGLNRLQTYQACENPKCRLEVRRRAGRITADKLKKSGPERRCLQCDKEFVSAGKFNRICPACHGNRQANPMGYEWWGKII